MSTSVAATSSLMFCFNSAIVLGRLLTPCCWAIPRESGLKQTNQEILQATEHSRSVRLHALVTSAADYLLSFSQHEPLLSLAGTTKFGGHGHVTTLAKGSCIKWCNDVMFQLQRCVRHLQRTIDHSHLKLPQHSIQSPLHCAEVFGGANGTERLKCD